MNIVLTLIRFCVSVPVLSVHMTVVLPSVSTLSRCFISAFFLAMRLLPMVNARVTVGNNPSGTLATIIPIANIRLAIMAFSNTRLTRKKVTPSMIAMVLITLINRFNSFLIGVSVSSVSWVSCTTWPICVSMAVAYTKALPLPLWTSVPEKIIFRLSRMLSWVHSRWRNSGSLSPVRLLRSIFNLFCSMSLPSAAIRSPSSSKMTSPGTNLLAVICCSCPSRNTVTICGNIFLKLSIICSAWYSWI